MLLNDTSHHKACPFFLYPTVVTCRRRELSNPSSLPSPHDRLAVVQVTPGDHDVLRAAGHQGLGAAAPFHALRHTGPPARWRAARL